MHRVWIVLACMPYESDIIEAVFKRQKEAESYKKEQLADPSNDFMKYGGYYDIEMHEVK